MIASLKGHSRVVRILLIKGANVSIADDDGCTALHASAQEGHRARDQDVGDCRGTDLQVATHDQGATPLHWPLVYIGHSTVMSVLIKAGANPNGPRLDGETPLFMAAQNGQLGAFEIYVSGFVGLWPER